MEAHGGDVCDVCGAMDGKVISLADCEPGVTVPPFHPNCRGTTCPYFDDMDGERAARGADGKVYYVPAGMTFEEWKNKYVNSGKKSTLASSEKSGILLTRGMAMGLRGSVSHILTEDEIASIKVDAEALGIDLSVLRFNEGSQTGFRDRAELIFIRGDILPDFQSSIARDCMSQRAVLAHEYYGHFKHHPSEYSVGDWRDEFRASYSAALNAPNLSDEDRRYLMIDAYDRAKEAGAFEGYDETARRIIYGF